MDIAFLKSIIENGYKLPEGFCATEISPQLISDLGSTNSELREASYNVLSGLISSGVDVHYTAEQLNGIGVRVAKNLTLGIGVRTSDSVFRRSFSILILNQLIILDLTDQYLTESEIRIWLEQGLEYFINEKDLRGYVPLKGWAHAIAHTADFLCVISKNRFINAEDSRRILGVVADKVIEPASHIYLYEEDERLAHAVTSVLLRNLVDMTYLNGWLNRFSHPQGGIIWSESFFDEAQTIARHNTISFLRCLYFQLLLRETNVHQAQVDEPISIQEELLSGIIEALKAIDDWVYSNGTSN